MASNMDLGRDVRESVNGHIFPGPGRWLSEPPNISC